MNKLNLILQEGTHLRRASKRNNLKLPKKGKLLMRSHTYFAEKSIFNYPPSQLLIITEGATVTEQTT